jgi:predicted dehydrogenase
LATSVAEGAEIAGLASKRGLVLMPGHTFLYSPPVVTIHDLISSGALGDLLFISSSRVNLGLHQSDVSVVWDLAPHDFSILRYWLGETPTHISATARACVGDVPDVAFIDLEFDSGPIAHVELAWLAPSKLRRTTIVGSEKMVVYDDTSNEPVRIFDSGVHLREPETFGEFRLTYRTGDIVSPRIDASEPLSLELRDFCQSIRKGSPPRSSSDMGLEVVRMMEAGDRSLAFDGARVDVIHGIGSPRVERETAKSTV